MNLVEEKPRGLILLGLQSWPLQLIEHFSNTTSVAPPPAGPAGCLPLYLLHLLNLSFKIRAPNGGCILQLRAYQSFVCNPGLARYYPQNPPHKTRVYTGWVIRSYYPLWAICGFYEFLVLKIAVFSLMKI